jgi:hypothetical protein
MNSDDFRFVIFDWNMTKTDLSKIENQTEESRRFMPTLLPQDVA